jgi:hypothetical protein
MMTDDFESAMKMRFLEVNYSKKELLKILIFFFYSQSLDFVYQMEIFRLKQQQLLVQIIVKFNVLMIMNYNWIKLSLRQCRKYL